MVKTLKIKVMMHLESKSGEKIKLGKETMRVGGIPYMTFSKSQKLKPHAKLDLSQFIVVGGNKMFKVEK